MLTGLFGEVEHAAIYKPAPGFRPVVQSLRMRERSAAVLDALRAFEAEFEYVVENELSRPEKQSEE
jgi:hypothetical protein